MLSKIFLLPELIPALLALPGLLVGVDSLVSLHGRPLREGGATQLTDKWLLSRVSPPVALQRR